MLLSLVHSFQPKETSVKQIRTRLTYANVMSSIAVFLVLGGATAFAAATIGTGDIKAGAIKTGKIAKEAVKAGKLGNGAVKTEKIADAAVTTPKLADNAVTGAKVDEASLGEVPNAANAANAAKVGGQTAGSFVPKSDLLWAIVNETGGLVAGSGAVSSIRVVAGNFRVTFNRTVTNCATSGTATDIDGGAAPQGASARIVGTDNREQTAANTVDVLLTDPAGAVADPAIFDGFMVTVFC
jgi:hypothetical protein